MATLNVVLVPKDPRNGALARAWNAAYDEDVKTVSVEQARRNFASILEYVAEGQIVDVVQRRKRVARIIPPNGKSAGVSWADTWQKADAIFGKKPLRGKPGSQIIIESRR